MLEYAITAIVCMITAIVIQRIYKKEHNAAGKKEGVTGILWFGWAIFVWGMGACITLLAVKGLGVSPSTSWLIYFGVCVSLLNSMFILLSLPSIEHTGRPSAVVRFVARFTEKEFIFLYGVIMAMLVFVFFAASYTNVAIDSALIWLIDIPISILVALALLQALNKAFFNRQMRFMVLPSTVLFILILIAVTHRIVPVNKVPEVLNNGTWELVGIVTAVSFKFLFILLFSILLYSWKFLSEKEEKESRLESVLEQQHRLRTRNNELLRSNAALEATVAHLGNELHQLRESSKIELSERQKEVLGNLALLGEQKSYTEIAEAMHISVDGFQAHIHQIKKVLKVSGTSGKHLLIKYAIENDLLRYATLGPGTR